MRIALILLLVLMIFSLRVRAYETPPSYHDHDYQSLVTFLEVSDGTMKNGERLNAKYDPEKPDTWTGITWLSDEKLRVKEISMTNLPLVGNLILSGLTHLERLAFSFSLIEVVKLDGCIALESLACPNNEIMVLSLTNCPSLVQCVCFNNKLTELALGASPNLRLLDCSGNRLVNLNLNGLAKLRELTCVDNQLVHLDLVGCTALETLQCQNNLLTYLHLDVCSDLWLIKCNNNKLSYLTIADFSSLREVHCQDNRLTFASLPLFYPPNYGRYEYAPQEKIDLGSVAIGASINLGEQWLIGEKETLFKWYRQGGGQIQPTTADKGVFSFDESFAGDQIFCMMTNEALRKLTLETELISFAGSLNPPTIEAEPEDVTSAVDSSVSFSVLAQAAPSCQLVYQWEFLKEGANSWQELEGANTNIYQLDKVSYAQNGYLYRCRLQSQREEEYSEEKYTREALLAVVSQPEIILEPTNLTVANKGQASFSITAKIDDGHEGGELVYLWQIKKEGQANWQDIENLGPILDITNVDYENYNNSSIRCILKNHKNGIYSNPVTSKEVTLRVVSDPEFILEPLDCYGPLGGEAIFSVELVSADGQDGGQLSYQWQKANKDQDDWTDLEGANSSTYQVSPIREEHNQCRYRCLAFNIKDGVKSKTVTSSYGKLYLELSYSLTINLPSGHDENNPISTNKGSLLVLEIEGPLNFVESLTVKIDDGQESSLPIKARSYYLLANNLKTGEHSLILRLVDTNGQETLVETRIFFTNSRIGFGFGRFNFD